MARERSFHERREQRDQTFARVRAAVESMQGNTHEYVEAATHELLTLAAAEHFSVKDIGAAITAARGGANHEARGRAADELAEAVHSLPEQYLNKWCVIVDFLNHDIGHLDPSMIERSALMFQSYLLPQGTGFESKVDSPLVPEVDAVYRDHMSHAGSILRQMEYPYKFVMALIDIEEKKRVKDIERVDVGELCDAIARTMHLRFSTEDFILTTEQYRHPERNEIIVRADYSELETHTAMLWSVLYNLVKNAMHALIVPRHGVSESPLAKRIVEHQLPEHPNKIWLSVDDLSEHDVTLVTVADSGRGLDVHQLLTVLKKMISQGLLDTGSIPGAARTVLERWPQHPFVLRNLKLGHALDLASLPRLSGGDSYEVTGGKKKPSGLGLWGAQMLAEKMGGKILATNSGDPEWGAVFTVILPNHHFRTGQRSGNVVRLVERGLTRGEVPVRMPRSTAA